MRSIAFFDGVCGHLAFYDEAMGAIEIITARAFPGQSIEIDDAVNSPLLFEGGYGTGQPLQWASEPKYMGRNFARDFGARLYKKREGYDARRERMKVDHLLALADSSY